MTASLSQCSANVALDAKGQYTGGLIGHLGGTDVVVSNCVATGEVHGHHLNTGGFVGLAEYRTTIIDCEAHGNVSCDLMDGFAEVQGYLGGFIGSSRGIIRNSFATGNTTVLSTHCGSTGGFVGWTENNGPIENCYATGDVIGQVHTGGFSGVANVSLTNCFATGNVSGLRTVGGFTGFFYSKVDTYADYPVLTNCYSLGTATGGEKTAGFMGSMREGIVRNCYTAGFVISTDLASAGAFCGAFHQDKATVELAGCYYDQNIAGNLPPCPDDAALATGMTTANMLKAETYVGWDIGGPGSAWGISQGVTYPYFNQYAALPGARSYLLSALAFDAGGFTGHYAVQAGNHTPDFLFVSDETTVSFTVDNLNADRIVRVFPPLLAQADTPYYAAAIGVSNLGIGSPYYSTLTRTVTDKTALIAAINLANSKQQAAYTPASWDHMVAMLAHAQAVSGQSQALQPAIDEATANLQQAIDNLVLIVTSTPTPRPSSRPTSNPTPVPSVAPTPGGVVDQTPTPSGPVVTPAPSPSNPQAPVFVPKNDEQQQIVSRMSQQNQQALGQIQAAGITIISVGDYPVPLFGLRDTKVWGLVNALLIGIGVVLSVVGLTSLRNKRAGREYKRTRTMLRCLSAALGVLAVVVFLLTQHLSALMVLVDRWTPLLMAILVAQVVLFLMGGQRESREKPL